MFVDSFPLAILMKHLAGSVRASGWVAVWRHSISAFFFLPLNSIRAFFYMWNTAD